MFETLSNQLSTLFKKLSGRGRLTESHIAEAVEEIKKALLDADVHFDVVTSFVDQVKKLSIGEEKIDRVTSGDQFIEAVHRALVDNMSLSKDDKPFTFSSMPATVLLCGLQGSGKTTTAGKLAKYFLHDKKCKKPLLVALDLARPAAIEQLKILGESLGIEVYYDFDAKDPVVLSQKAKAYSMQHGFDLTIFDTAGRLHVDDSLMSELHAIEEVVKPHYIFYVANAATGQDAVNSAKAFDKKMEITGSILTMLDGDVRAGAALSITAVTQKPLLFEGIGERSEDLQPFNAHSMADRILDRGDQINLVRRMKQHIKEDEAKKAEEKLKKAKFTFDDFLQQLQGIKKMGSMSGLLGMMPGFNQMKKQFKSMPTGDKEMGRMEALMRSMTADERACIVHLSPSRRQRIAKGSGLPLVEVNKFVKSYSQLTKLLKNERSRNDMMKRMGGMKWR